MADDARRGGEEDDKGPGKQVVVADKADLPLPHRLPPVDMPNSKC